MKRLMSLLVICLISTNVGCSLCSSCDDYSYGAFGGVWERTDPVNGRVGSAFTPSGYAITSEETVQAQRQESSEDSEAESVMPPRENESDPNSAYGDDSRLET